MESVGRDNVSNSSIVTHPLHDLFSMYLRRRLSIKLQGMSLVEEE